MNKKNMYKVAVVFVVALALILPGATTIANDDKGREPPTVTELSVSPALTTVETGVTFTVGVYVEPSEGLRGISIDNIIYDASLIHANSITFEGFFDPYGTFPSFPTIDNVAGSINEVYELILGSPGNSVSTPGYFVNISFTSQSILGTSPVNLVSIVLANVSDIEIPSVTNNGSVVVEEFVTLTMSVVGSGTTDPALGVHTYAGGTVVDLEAFPDVGWEFAGWSGDINTTDNPTTITMDGNKAVTATFTEAFYDLTISVVGDGTTDPAPGVHTYACGTVVDLEAFPDYGWAFSGWSGDINTMDNPTTITMDSDKAVTATFRQEWTACLEIEADIREMDTVCFGEKTLASDGIDMFDIPKPGAPPSPYVYAWFATDLTPPYDELWEDYRHYDIANTYQVWDLWIHTSGSGQYTQVTISWDPSDLSTVEYDYVGLFYALSGNMVADMKNMKGGGSSYEYTSGHCCATHFQIIAWNNNCPVGVDDYYETNQGTELIVGAPGILENDYDLDDNPIYVDSLDTTATYGTVDLDSHTDGYFRYTPPVGWFGTDEFSYEVTDGVCTDTATVYIEVTELTRISIEDGWNIISVPVGGTCDEPCCVDKTTIVVEYLGGFYSWNDAISSGLILGFTYGWGNGVYYDEQCLESGEGYWLWSYEDVDLLVPNECEDDENNHITFLDVGWNLIGVPYTDDLDISTEVRVDYNGFWYEWNDATANGYILQFVYGWNRPNQHYELTNTLESGYGYWVYAYEGCALKRWYP